MEKGIDVSTRARHTDRRIRSYSFPPLPLQLKFSDRKHASSDRKSTAPCPFPISTLRLPDSASHDRTYRLLYVSLSTSTNHRLEFSIEKTQKKEAVGHLAQVQLDIFG